MEIRKADSKDLDTLLTNRLDFLREMQGKAELPEGYEQAAYDYMKEHLTDNSMVAWMAVEDEKIVAAAVVCFYQVLPLLSNTTGNTGSIYNVSTHPDYRRKGLAFQLMKHIIQEAKDRKVGRLYLTASEMGKPLYEKLGFEVLTKDMVYKII